MFIFRVLFLKIRLKNFGKLVEDQEVSMTVQSFNCTYYVHVDNVDLEDHGL